MMSSFKYKIEEKKKVIFSKVDRIVFFLTVIYFFLDNSFLAPVIFGVPIGISGQVLLIPLMTYYLYTSKVKINQIIILILIWDFFTILSIARSFPTYGLQSLRSSTYCIDSNYIIIGNIIAQNNIKRIQFKSIFWKTLLIGNIYLLLLPLRGFLLRFTPQLTAFSGYSVPILFTFGNASFFSSVFFFSENGFPLNGNKIHIKILSFFSLMFTFTYATARYNYFIVFILAVYTFFKKPNSVGKISLYLILACILLSIILSIGIKFSFRGGEITSLRYFIDHFISSFGISTSNIDGQSSGFYLRTNWWNEAFQKLFSSFNNIVFGLGQGIPLTNFMSSQGVLVRDLHNSYVQILVRDGLIGFSIFIFIHIKLISNLINNITVTKNLPINNFYHTGFLFIIAIMINSLMQNTLEASYKAIPYYLMLGLIGSYKIKRKK